VFQRIEHQVAQDALDTTGVDLRDALSVGSSTRIRLPYGGGHRLDAVTTRRTTVRMSVASASNTAAPASKREISSSSASSASNRSS